MASTPKRSLNEALDHMKGEVGRSFNDSVKKMSDNLSGLRTNVQSMKSTFSSTSVGQSLESSGKMIGQNVSTLGRSLQTMKSNSTSAISSSVAGAVEDFHTLCRNFERNVQALTSSGAGSVYSEATSFSAPAPPSMVSFPPSTSDFLEGVASPPPADKQTAPPQSAQPPPSSSSPPASSISSESASSLEEVPEDTPQPDFSSVSATSVFSIGYVGPPLMGPADPETTFESNPDDAKQSPRQVVVGGPDIAQDSGGPEPLLRLEDVRRAIGRALIVSKRMRSLGFRESSWVNKMPWHNPRPAYLAKGLQWPQEKFSSVGARREYHKRARRRGRYLIGPTPGWSWFAADILLLFFLVYNPAGSFLI